MQMRRKAEGNYFILYITIYEFLYRKLTEVIFIRVNNGYNNDSYIKFVSYE